MDIDEFHGIYAREAFQLGDREVLPHECLIRRPSPEEPSGQKVAPRAMDVLVYLAQRPGEVVSAETLIDQLWNGGHATPNAVHKCIVELRHAFEDDARQPTVFQTIPKRGYKLLLSPKPIPRAHEPQAALFRIGGGTAKEGSGIRTTHVILFAAIGIIAILVAVLGRQKPETAMIRSDEAVAIIQAPEPSHPRTKARLLYDLLLDELTKSPTISATILDTDDIDYIAPKANSLHRITFEVVRESTVVRISPSVGPVDHIHTIDSNAVDPEGIRESSSFSSLVWDLRILLSDQHRTRLKNWGTDDLHAYQFAYEACLHRRHLNREHLFEARDLLEKAVVSDSYFVEAYGMLGSTYETLAQLAPSTSEREAVRLQMLQLIDKATKSELEESLVDSLKRRLVLLSEANPIRLERMYRMALLEDPNDRRALRQYAELLVGAGLLEEGRAYHDAAIDVSEPKQAEIYRLTSAIDIAGVKDLSQSVKLAAKYVEQFPQYTLSLYGLVVKNAALGNIIQAQRYLERLRQSDVEGNWAYAAEIELAAQTNELTPHSAELGLALDDPRMTNLAKGKIHFVLGNVHQGIEAWKSIEPGLQPLLWPFISQMEKLFDPSVPNDPRYQLLLNDLGIGSRWRHYLSQRVTDLSTITGIEPTSITLDAPAPPVVAYHAARLD